METSVKQRLIGFIKHENLSQKKFETLVGLSNGYVNNIRQSISPEKLQSIALCFPNLSLEWLLTGEGDMLLGEPKTSAPAVPTVSYTTGRPYYNVDFLAGFDLVFNDQTINPEYYIDFAPYNRQGAIWCNITGDSMTPKISSGDIIALLEIEGWREFLSFGEIYAIVTTNGLRTVKIIRKGSADDRVRLVPLNTEEYDEQEIPLSVISKVFQVIGCMKKL